LRKFGQHIGSVVSEYKIPDSLSRTFDWLASEDVEVKQQLLNHIRKTERDLVIEAGRLQVEVMFRHRFGENSDAIKSFTHTLTAGKHNLTLVADLNASGYSIENRRVNAVVETVIPTRRPVHRYSGLPKSKKSDNGWIVVVVGIVIFLIVIALSNSAE
jgi:hypothetical protein